MQTWVKYFKKLLEGKYIKHHQSDSRATQDIDTQIIKDGILEVIRNVKKEKPLIIKELQMKC